MSSNTVNALRPPSPGPNSSYVINKDAEHMVIMVGIRVPLKRVEKQKKAFQLTNQSFANREAVIIRKTMERVYE